jgi:hypothetical protein
MYEMHIYVLRGVNTLQSVVVTETNLRNQREERYAPTAHIQNMFFAQSICH